MQIWMSKKTPDSFSDSKFSHGDFIFLFYFDIKFDFATIMQVEWYKYLLFIKRIISLESVLCE